MSEEKRYCAVCSGEIEADRLDALPDTRLCIKHGKEIAKYGGEFTATGTHINVGRGLKGLTAGVEAKFDRNQDAIDRLRDDFLREQIEKERAGG